jgi:nucleotidyltransferase/DNA polymerase involved in DNA repair
MSIRVIPGIGPKGEQFLNSKNIRTISDLRHVPEATLREWFGRWGAHLFERARGIDDAEVFNDGIRKSLGEQETFETDTRDRAAVLARLEAMAERIVRKLREQEFQGFRTVTLTVRFGDFQTCNRSRTLKTAILMNGEAHAALRENAAALLEPFFDARENPRNKALRLIGLRVEKIF